ncbi:MAG TPA: NeuD/PglB/VioB family sugar acetyltransferase [Bacteroidia bacterium]|nr:NeuD/PglB/VioB family sugar acetyltransferase [Bacteroidia bacterium]
MKELVIFGVGKIADVVYYYAKNECGFTVAAFTADAAFATGNGFDGLPLVPFEELKAKYPPEKYDLFVAVGYHDMNRLRQQKCAEAIAMGYHLVSVVSPHSRVPSNVKVGANCFIMPPAIVHPCVTLGDNTFVWSGALVGHHSEVGANCWITSGSNIGGNVRIGENCFLAMNATIAHSVNTGAACFIGANALVTKHLTDKQVVIAENHKPIKLNSDQFLRLSKFSSL